MQPSIIETSTLPLLFHSLPETAPSIDQTKQRSAYRAILAAIRDLCVSPSLFETLVIRIPNKLESVSAAPTTSGAEAGDQFECDVAYAHDLVSCLDDTVKRKIKDKHVDVTKHYDSIVPKLWRMAVTAAMAKGEGRMWRDRRLLGLLARLTDRLTWALDAR